MRAGSIRPPGNSLGQQCLAGARWADQQHALGNARPETAIVLRILQEIDDRDQLRLGLIPRHIGERHTGVLSTNTLARLLPMLRNPPMPCFSAKRRNRKNQTPKKDTAGRIHDSTSLSRALQHAGIGYVVLRQAIGKIGFDPRCHDRRLAPAVRRLQAPGHRTIRHQHFGHAPSSSAFSNSL